MAYGNYGGDRGGGFQRKFVPVRIGDEIDVKVEAVGAKGDGVVKKKGFVLFVPGVKEGEEIRVRITKVLKKVGFAEKIGPAQGPIEEDTPPPRREERGDIVPPPVVEPEESPEDSEEE